MNHKNVQPPYKSTTEFDIRNLIDKLEPAKDKGKYLCPVCGDDNFSINQSSGAYFCFGNNCDTGEIAKALSPQGNGVQRRTKPKSYKERDKQAISNSALIEIKVDELVLEVREQVHTPQQAIVAITTWAQEQGFDRFECKQLLREKLKELADLESRANDPDEAFKLEIQRLAKESDQFKRLRLRGQICSHYRVSAKDVEKLVASIEKANSTPRKTVFSLSEFLNQETDALTWIVPGFLPRRDTVLLAAQAKAGKTNLATDLIHAALTGGEFLGEKVSKGKVLFVSCDESGNSTRRRFRARGFDLLEDLNNLQIMTHLDLTDLSPLESQLEDFRPDVVVVDSLTAISLNIGVPEKDPEFAKNIYRLKDLLGRYGAAGVLIHHENKDTFAKGLNQISGSSRIPAAVWGIWQLKAVNPDNDTDPARTLRIKPREGAAVSLALEINPRDLWTCGGIFQCFGEIGDELGEKKTQAERVLALLEQFSPRGLTYKEIDGRLQIGRSLYQVLDRLEERQQIAKRRSTTDPRSWVYALPGVTVEGIQQGGDSPPPSVKDDDFVEVSQSTDIQSFGSIQHQFNNYSTTIQQVPVEEDVLNCQTDYPVSNSAPIQQVEQKRGGVCPEKFVESDSSVTVEHLKPGDVVRYCGKDLRSMRVCGSLLLHVLDVDDEQGVARVRAESWNPQIIKTYELSELRRVHIQTGGRA